MSLIGARLRPARVMVLAVRPPDFNEMAGVCAACGKAARRDFAACVRTVLFSLIGRCAPALRLGRLRKVICRNGAVSLLWQMRACVRWYVRQPKGRRRFRLAGAF